MNSHLPLTRRAMLRASAVSLLAAGVWPGRIFGSKPGKSEFSFIVVNDLHYHGRPCGPWFEKVVGQMNGHAKKPAFCLVVGDLADDGLPEQYGPLRDILRTLKIPYHVVIGNHDHREPDDRKPYESAFPNSINYYFEHAGWQFIGMDSSEGQKVYASIQPASLHWLDETLPKLDKEKPTVLFTHFPLGPQVTYRSVNGDDVLERFKEFNLVAVYNGHYHGFTERVRGPVAITTNNCCAFFKRNHDGTNENGYFLCQAREESIVRQFVEVKSAINRRGGRIPED